MGRELLINEDWPPIYAARRLGVSPNALTSRATRMGWRRGGLGQGPHDIQDDRRRACGDGLVIRSPGPSRLAAPIVSTPRQDLGEAVAVQPALVGRPWLTRQDHECAFVVAGEGPSLLACRMPGKARRRGWAAYCVDHDLVIYRPRSAPVAATPDTSGTIAKAVTFAKGAGQ